MVRISNGTLVVFFINVSIPSIVVSFGIVRVKCNGLGEVSNGAVVVFEIKVSIT